MSITSRLAARLTRYEDPRSAGSRLRARRARPLLEAVERLHAEKGAVRIVDLGGRALYWRTVLPEALERCRVSVTLVNLEPPDAAAEGGAFEHVRADACDLSAFPEGSFDIAHSNSVIEHLGSWGRMVRFAGEVRRLAPAYFVQTPNFWFPVEPHFMAPGLHWLPEPLRVALVRRFDLGHVPRARTLSEAVAAVEGIRLLDRRMLLELFPDARLRPERVGGLTKSWVATRGIP